MACINKIIEKINDTKQNKVGIHIDPFLPRIAGNKPLKIEPNNGKNTKSLSILSFHTICIIYSYRSS